MERLPNALIEPSSANTQTMPSMLFTCRTHPNKFIKHPWNHEMITTRASRSRPSQASDHQMWPVTHLSPHLNTFLIIFCSTFGGLLAFGGWSESDLMPRPMTLVTLRCQVNDTIGVISKGPVKVRRVGKDNFGPLDKAQLRKALQILMANGNQIVQSELLSGIWLKCKW